MIRRERVIFRGLYMSMWIWVWERKQRAWRLGAWDGAVAVWESRHKSELDGDD